MALAEPIYDPEDDDTSSRPKSAQERAEERWGMHPGGIDDENGPATGAEDAEGQEESALDRAGQRWGSAGVHEDGAGDSTAAGGAAGTDAGKPEAPAPADNEGAVGAVKSQLKKHAKKYLALAALPLAGIVTLVIIVSSMLSGPGEFVHFAQLLQQLHFDVDQTLTGNRGGLLIKYAHTADNPIERNMSYIGNKFADRYEDRLKEAGITPEYENRRIKRLAIDPTTTQGRQALDSLASQGIDISTLAIDPDGKVRVDIDQPGPGTARFRRQAIGGMVNTLDLDIATSAIMSRTLRVRAGVGFHPLNNIVRNADENLRQYYDRINEQNAEYIRNGVDTTRPTSNAGQTTDEDGNPVTDAQDAGAAQETSDIIADATNTDLTVDERAGRLKGKLTAGVGATGYLATVCAIKAIGDSANAIQQANIVLPLMRTGMQYKSVGSQIQAGTGFNSDELGAHKERLYDQETGSSVFNAKSMQAELGEPQTGSDMPAGAKPGTEKPAFFGTLDSVINAVPGGSTFCGAVNSAVGGWVLTGIGVGLNATGPVGALVTGASETAQYLLAGPVIEGIVRWISGEQIAADAKGELLGNYANYGGILANNEKSITHGGIELTEAEEIELDNEQRSLAQAQNQQKNFFARYLDTSNVNSLVAKTVYESPLATNRGSGLAVVLSMPGKLLSMATSTMGNMLPKAEAATRYDYGFPEFGFTLDELNDERYQDPYAIARIVEPRLKDLNDAYGTPCFGTTVDPTTGKINAAKQGGMVYADIPDKCKDRSNTELTYYRFYLVDQTAGKAILCYDFDDEEACAEVGAVSSIDNSPIATGVGAGKIVSVAEQEFAKNGNQFLETCGNNCGPEVQKYTGGPSGPAAPWCAWFVSWVYREAGYEFTGTPAGADGNLPAVEGLMAWFSQHGIFFSADSAQKPQPGDVIMYDKGVHTGVVVKVTGDNIETIEGNTSGDGSFNADGETVGRKIFNYKTSARHIDFGRLKSF